MSAGTLAEESRGPAGVRGTAEHLWLVTQRPSAVRNQRDVQGSNRHRVKGCNEIAWCTQWEGRAPVEEKLDVRQ